MKKAILFISIAIVLSSCFAHTHQVNIVNADNPSGFFMGIWHGIIAPITFLISIFSDSVTVWDVNNTGNWYTFGFLIGVGAFSIGATKSSSN